MNQIRKLLDVFFATLAIGLFFFGVAILGYQIFVFCKSGVWLPISIANMVNSDWLRTNWIGIHKLIEFVPASLSFFAVGWLVLQVGVRFLEGKK
jgi:hypothetical protein